MNPISHKLLCAESDTVTVSLRRRLVLPRSFDGRHWNMQGGCRDEKYAYYALNSGGDSRESVTRIYKVDLSSFQVVMQSGDMYISHANDIAYDPHNRRLVVSWCDIEPDKVGIVDPDTLTLRETLTIPQRHFSIAYCADRHTYVAGKSRTYDLALLDDNFEPHTLLTGVEGFVKQGLECDSELIYFLHSAKADNTVFVYDWQGNLRRRILIPYEAEGENLFITGDRLVCAFNDRTTDEAVICELTVD